MSDFKVMSHRMPLNDRTVQAIQTWGHRGFSISVVFGPAHGYEAIYIVTAKHVATGREFDSPFGALFFSQIADILDREIPAMMQQQTDIDNTTG